MSGRLVDSDSSGGEANGRSRKTSRTKRRTEIANSVESEKTMLGKTRGYKIRSYANGQAKDGSQYMNYALTVPNEIAEAIPGDLTFVPRMTDDGLLYEPVQQAKTELPAWARNGHEAKGKKESASP